MNRPREERDVQRKRVYPDKYIQSWTCRGGNPVTLRPIRPEDKLLEKLFIEGLSSESSRYRFFERIREVSQEILSQFCDIDYDSVVAIMAEYETDDMRRNVGVGRLIVDSDMKAGEFAIAVADDFQGRGLGHKLLSTIIEIAREKKLKNITG
jgi:acetyltransferase